MTRYAILIVFILSGCTTKNPDAPANEVSVPVDSAREFYRQETQENFDYSRFQGIYDNESTTTGFSAILTLAENGNDLSFTLSVTQGNSCKGHAEGKVFMMSHEPAFYVGFYEAENCPLQFSFMLQDDKVDVKEINLCKLREGNCSFEGSYVKRKT